MGNFKKQLDDWYDNDQHQKIIDAIENLPLNQQTSELIGTLAVAYNNVGTIETLSKAVELLKSLEKELSEDYKWNYRMGYALYYLDRYAEALVHFEKSLTFKPDDEQVQYFIENIKTLSQEHDKYETTFNGFEIQIPKTYMSDERVAFAKTVIEAYPQKLTALAEFCKESKIFKSFYPEETVDTIIKKLHLPILRVDDVGGRFVYCNHEMDADHIIEIEFVGVIDSFFSVNIDG